jgi:hypothetical protein
MTGTPGTEGEEGEGDEGPGAGAAGACACPRRVEKASASTTAAEESRLRRTSGRSRSLVGGTRAKRSPRTHYTRRGHARRGHARRGHARLGVACWGPYAEHLYAARSAAARHSSPRSRLRRSPLTDLAARLQHRSLVLTPRVGAAPKRRCHAQSSLWSRAGGVCPRHGARPRGVLEGHTERQGRPDVRERLVQRSAQRRRVLVVSERLRPDRPLPRHLGQGLREARERDLRGRRLPALVGLRRRRGRVLRSAQGR